MFSCVSHMCVLTSIIEHKHMSFVALSVYKGFNTCTGMLFALESDFEANILRQTEWALQSGPTCIILSCKVWINERKIVLPSYVHIQIWLTHRLAIGCLSPRKIYTEIKKYEKERTSNQSTYWVIFELLWRDYFRFVALKYGNRLFYLSGIQGKHIQWKQDKHLFAAWKGDFVY